MKHHTRAAVAYIAGRLITNRQSYSLYDHSRCVHTAIGGIVEPERIAAFDHERGAHLSGSKVGDSLSLYDYADGVHLSLRIEGAKFSGYNYSTSTHFSGSVKDNVISLLDYTDSLVYTFSI
jgi:hypothetical protein